MSYPEVFFALVGPLGTDLDVVEDILSQELGKVNYKLETVSMSSTLTELSEFQLKDSPEDERIRTRMDAGDAYRKKVNSSAALVHLSVTYVAHRRLQLQANGHERRAFVFRSLKHKEELRALRKVYGDALTCVSVYAPEGERLERLARKIARSHKASSLDWADRARELIRRDQAGGDKKFGQNVAGVFPLADAFIRQSTRERMEGEISRLVELLFGNWSWTPTIDEYGMFHAKAASLRSADLSRQVGAAIIDADGTLLAQGCNEVPRAGGGNYWAGDKPDRRDFRVGYDSNVEYKLATLREVFSKLAEENWLTPEKAALGAEELASVAAGDGGLLERTRVSSLLEFGRVVHAEMNAIVQAARRGVRLDGTTMFCTTYPCHMCARHLLAAGVARVVYIEPYPKSLTTELYKHSVRSDNECADPKAMALEPFVGAAPRLFGRVFEAAEPDRKSADGAVIEWDRSKSRPRFESMYESHIERELIMRMEFAAALRADKGSGEGGASPHR